MVEKDGVLTIRFLGARTPHRLCVVPDFCPALVASTGSIGLDTSQWRDLQHVCYPSVTNNHSPRFHSFIQTFALILNRQRESEQLVRGCLKCPFQLAATLSGSVLSSFMPLAAHWDNTLHLGCVPTG